jgi:hypothetical protein
MRRSLGEAQGPTFRRPLGRLKRGCGDRAPAHPPHNLFGPMGIGNPREPHGSLILRLLRRVSWTRLVSDAARRNSPSALTKNLRASSSCGSVEQPSAQSSLGTNWGHRVGVWVHTHVAVAQQSKQSRSLLVHDDYSPVALHPFRYALCVIASLTNLATIALSTLGAVIVPNVIISSGTLSSTLRSLLSTQSLKNQDLPATRSRGSPPRGEY